MTIRPPSFGQGMSKVSVTDSVKRHSGKFSQAKNLPNFDAEIFELITGVKV
jgi:hypothetical protein